MPAFFIHSLILVLSVAGSYLWLITPTLTPYTLQLVAGLVLVYAALHWFRKGSHSHKKSTIPLDLTLLTIIILLLVVETGALTSPLIFLLYFLLFAVALLFEIEATLLLTGTLLSFFLLFPSTDLTDLAHLSELVALIMITPLALYMSHQHSLNLHRENELLTLNKHLANEETDTLIFLSNNLSRTLSSALDRLSLIIPQVSGTRLKQELESLYQNLRQLYRTGKELQELIDQETDEK